jgi:hypothetical protein
MPIPKNWLTAAILLALALFMYGAIIVHML